MDQNQIGAYLERLNYTGETKPDEALLERLIRAHLEQIPFENLDVFDGKQIPSLGEEDLYRKIIQEKRGGFCFELNTLFSFLLEGLGFSVYPVAARILWNKTKLPPLSHMGLVVTENGEKYFCDVGYGGPGPKGLVRLQSGEQEIEGERFRLVRTREEQFQPIQTENAEHLSQTQPQEELLCPAHLQEGEIRVERFWHGEWKPLMQFADRAVRRQDFELLNFYCAKCPKILFTQKRVVNICTPGGSKALMDMEFTWREGSETGSRTLQTQQELEQCLRREFGIGGSL